VDKVLLWRERVQRAEMGRNAAADPTTAAAYLIVAAATPKIVKARRCMICTVQRRYS
jgi:hypothetical protein